VVIGSLLMLGAASKPQIAEALDLVPRLQKKASAIGQAVPAPETNGGEPRSIHLRL
jgi:hypothetical protein